MDGGGQCDAAPKLISVWEGRYFFFHLRRVFNQPRKNTQGPSECFLVMSVTSVHLSKSKLETNYTADLDHVTPRKSTIAIATRATWAGQMVHMKLA